MPDDGAEMQACGASWLGSATRPEELDLSTDWNAFRLWNGRLDDHFLLSGIEDMKPRHQMATLRACLSCETLRIVGNRELQETEKNITVILQRLEDYAIGQVNEVVERKWFNSRIQAEGETFNNFVMSLRDLVRSCNFCRSCNDES